MDLLFQIQSGLEIADRFGGAGFACGIKPCLQIGQFLLVAKLLARTGIAFELEQFVLERLQRP
jgi:hypothetical protein